MWPFSRETISLAEHRRIMRSIDSEHGETHANLSQQIGELQSQMRAMQKAETEDGLNAISQAVAAQIDVLYVRAWDTPEKRTTAVQLAVRESIRAALTGSSSPSALKTTLTLQQWIDKEFGGHGLAARRKEDPPIPGEPLMSMEIAKGLVRKAVQAFT